MKNKLEEINKKSGAMDKLEKANNLREEIKQIESFLRLLKRGNKFEKDYGQWNAFTSMTISANIWTGSDNPNYHKVIENKEAMNACAESMIIALEKLLKAKRDSFYSIVVKLS